MFTYGIHQSRGCFHLEPNVFPTTYERYVEVELKSQLSRRKQTAKINFCLSANNKYWNHREILGILFTYCIEMRRAKIEKEEENK